jgi:hypothetical protein
MSVAVSIAYEIDQRIQILSIHSNTSGIYNNILLNINKIYQTNVDSIYVELLSEEGFANIERCLNDPMRVITPIDRYTRMDSYERLWVYAHRTDVTLSKPVDDCKDKYKVVVTAGTIDGTCEVTLECNSSDDYRRFINRLCNHLMGSVSWAPFKQYVTHNKNILLADDILMYIIPIDCKVDYIMLLSDPALPYDLDYAFLRLKWYMNPFINIQQIYNIIGDCILLITPGKRVPWLRNTLEISSVFYKIKGYDEISVTRLSAIAADYLNQFAVERVTMELPSMAVQPLRYTNIDAYNLSDGELIESIDRVIHSIIVKRSLH